MQTAALVLFGAVTATGLVLGWCVETAREPNAKILTWSFHIGFMTIAVGVGLLVAEQTDAEHAVGVGTLFAIIGVLLTRYFSGSQSHRLSAERRSKNS